MYQIILCFFFVTNFLSVACMCYTQFEVVWLCARVHWFLIRNKCGWCEQWRVGIVVIFYRLRPVLGDLNCVYMWHVCLYVVCMSCMSTSCMKVCGICMCMYRLNCSSCMHATPFLAIKEHRHQYSSDQTDIPKRVYVHVATSVCQVWTNNFWLELPRRQKYNQSCGRLRHFYEPFVSQ